MPVQGSRVAAVEREFGLRKEPTSGSADPGGCRGVGEGQLCPERLQAGRGVRARASGAARSSCTGTGHEAAAAGLEEPLSLTPLLL